jgi:hypothetical protein
MRQQCYLPVRSTAIAACNGSSQTLAAGRQGANRSVDVNTEIGGEREFRMFPRAYPASWAVVAWRLVFMMLVMAAVARTASDSRGTDPLLPVW